MDAFSVDSGALTPAYQDACAELERLQFADRLWRRSTDLWTDDPGTQRDIGARLGWLGALDFISPSLPRLRTFSDAARAEGISDVVLLGMGGSSLAPEVLHRVIGVSPGYPRFRMLDSVDPDAVRAALEPAAASLFVMASKSGSTIEPNVMAAEARRRLAAGRPDWNTRFVAITDDGTALHRRAIDERFRDVFVNPSDIGGRYSALSFFGMVPAALMGIDLDALIAAAREMAGACRTGAASTNPGLALGAFIAAGARTGRDKMTLVLPSGFEAFGLWVEQLIAESTGKHGTGIVPIAGQPGDAIAGSDRVAVAISVGADRPDASTLQRLQSAGVPLLTIALADATAVGAEFLRWEVATAAAGALLKINPFDEPNVQQAKDATRALLDVYSERRQLPAGEPLASIDGARLTVTREGQAELDGADAGSFLRLLRPGDYFCLLAYLPPDEERFADPLHELRSAVAIRSGCATMFGFGPRYLHSTGQLHKGGPNTGVFVIVTADPASDLPIPGQPFTFGVLEMAQAIGDFRSLDATGRRALHVQLPRRDPDSLRRISAALLAHVSQPV